MSVVGIVLVLAGLAGFAAAGAWVVATYRMTICGRPSFAPPAAAAGLTALGTFLVIA